jgi:hypothetical protein
VCFRSVTAAVAWNEGPAVLRHDGAGQLKSLEAKPYPTAASRHCFEGLREKCTEARRRQSVRAFVNCYP